MKLYLASFFEKKNFGPGRLIGIVDTGKPFDLEVKFKYPQLTPAPELKAAYLRDKEKNWHDAKFAFVKGYEDQLFKFFEELKEDAMKENKDPKDLLPFRDGDTLCSWERADKTNYRGILAGWLRSIEYDVVEN